MGDEEQAPQASGSGPQMIGGAPVIDDGTMEDIIDKLKILNYDQEFCHSTKPPFPHLGRSFFVDKADNPSAQFFYFGSLVSWLMRKAGNNNFAPPGQFDDPNATATNILQELKSMNLGRDIAPNKIRQGHGEAVLTILTLLMDKALLANRFEFRGIIYPAEKAEDDTQHYDNEKDASGGGGGDVGSDIDDNVEVDSESGDELYVPSVFGKKKDDENEMIVPQVSAEVWNLEVERVQPLLQYRVDEMRDWRARLEGAATLLKAVDKMYPEVRSLMNNMGDDVQKAIERIRQREQVLSQQFREHVDDYRVKLRELNSTQDAFNSANQNLQQLSNELNQVSEALEQVKERITDRESKISDTTPLMQIKDAVTKIRDEIKEMSLRIGILQHTVLHYTMRQSKLRKEQQLKGGLGGGGGDAQQSEQDFGSYDMDNSGIL